jgi:hypothetical protein
MPSRFNNDGVESLFGELRQVFGGATTFELGKGMNYIDKRNKLITI